MRYRLYLYKAPLSKAAYRELGLINAGFRDRFENEYSLEAAAKYLHMFGAEATVRQINEQLWDKSLNSCKCFVRAEYLPEPFEGIPYLYVVTSYKKAIEVLPKVFAIAIENDLLLYNDELKTNVFNEHINLSHITMRNRHQELRHLICDAMKPLWDIRCIENIVNSNKPRCSYTVTLRKDKSQNLLDRTAKFSNILYKSLLPSEKLFYDNFCYTIVGEGFSICYVLEAYKKHASHIGYSEDAVPAVKMARRIGTSEAFRWMRHCTDNELKDIYKRMDCDKLKVQYPNPADRFIASVNICKTKRKLLRYD